MEIQTMSALSLGRMIRERKIGCVEAVQSLIQYIEKDTRNINAYISLDGQAAIEEARAVQERLDRGEELSPLAGVPIGIKDNICTKGVRTTCASRMLVDFVPPYDAHVVECLRSGGMIPLGKLNMDEFAMGGANDTSFFGPVLNPWDMGKAPGGSSGGGAAAIAAGLAICALGSDTGGSIRQPSAFCGVTAIKPTYGTVSRYGLIACASSMDQIGPMGQDVRDCAAILQLIGGQDVKDSTSTQCTFDYSGCFDGRSGDPVIGLPTNVWEHCEDPSIRRGVEEAAKAMEKLGARIVECELPLLEQAAWVYMTLSCAEVYSNSARFDGVKFGYHGEAENLEELYCRSRGEGFGEEVKRRILLGGLVLSAQHYDSYYRRACSLRVMMRHGYSQLFEQMDMILSPVAPTLAYDLQEEDQSPQNRYRGNILAAAANLCGLPAIALPCGMSGEGLPMGMQIMGKAFSENEILRMADAYQHHTDFHTRRPL